MRDVSIGIRAPTLPERIRVALKFEWTINENAKSEESGELLPLDEYAIRLSEMSKM
jgi:hypothetical protein